MKIFLYISAAIVIVFAAVLLLNYFSGATKFTTEVYDIEGDFSSLLIDSREADITILPAEDGKCRVSAYMSGTNALSSEIKDGSLNISFTIGKAWYNYISIGFKSPKMTVYLPSSTYDALTVKANTGSVVIPSDFAFAAIDVNVSTGNVECDARASASVSIKASTGHITVSRANVSGDITLSVSTGGIEISETTSGGKVTADASTGDVEITSLNAESLAISTSSGDVTVTDTTISGSITQSIRTGETKFRAVSCETLTTDGTTGDLALESFNARDSINATRDTGDVTFTDADAGEITVKTGTGNVTGNLLSPKIFIAKTSSGKINVPESTEGGKCKITTSTGKIIITTP